MYNTKTKILILSHQKDQKYVLELLEHLNISFGKDIQIYANKDVLASEEPKVKLWQELNSSNIVLTIISSHFLADELLSKLHTLAIEMHNEKILEAVQIIARSVIMPENEHIREVKTIPKTPLAIIKNRDEAYSEIVEFIKDKIEIIALHYELLLEKLKNQSLENRLEELTKNNK